MNDEDADEDADDDVGRVLRKSRCKLIKVPLNIAHDDEIFNMTSASVASRSLISRGITYEYVLELETEARNLHSRKKADATVKC